MADHIDDANKMVPLAPSADEVREAVAQASRVVQFRGEMDPDSTAILLHAHVAQVQRIAELERELKDSEEEGCAAEDRIRELEAENARLREALEAAIEWDGDDEEGVEAVWLKLANKALEGE